MKNEIKTHAPTTDKENNNESKKDTTNYKAIMNLVNQFELFSNENGGCYITVNINDKNITYDIKGSNFRDWLLQVYKKVSGKYLSQQQLNSAIEIISSEAKFSGVHHQVYQRVAEKDGYIWLDLGNDEYEYVKIGPTGWQIVSGTEIRFIRSNATRPLPSPTPSQGNLSLLWRNINIPKDQQILVVTWLLECLRPTTSYPVLFLTGFQGTAKSTTQERLKRLIDPNASDLRGAPRKHDDTMIAAVNNYLLSFNNLSHLSSSQQDDFCCISTGGGYATRELYTTCQERVLSIKRPVIMNGITEVITAPDLLERSLVINLPPISADKRLPDTQLDQQFENDYPFIFTGLLDNLVDVLGVLPSIEGNHLPRMADFAKLGLAVNKVMEYPDNYFLNIFNTNQNESEETSINSSPIIATLIDFIENHHEWEGHYQALYDELTFHNRINGSGWPKSAKGLAEAIKRYNSYLTKLGISIRQGRRTNRGYTIRISMFEEINES